jgi:hypothetical protein
MAAHRCDGDTTYGDLNVVRMLNSDLVGNPGLSHARPLRATPQLSKPEDTLIATNCSAALSASSIWSG